MAGWPSIAYAQVAGRVRRIGVLMHVGQNSRMGRLVSLRLCEGLKELGWIEGRNLHFDVRWGPDDPDRYARQADYMAHACAMA